ncbi:hypothetical protein [Plebeiibacterium sediminum]|uniref:Uncharacterized protein n=1 Tax=Plebeiibacterium sediminum TaxID=2992112 RepID=A0AAE3M9E1_9BACT|nr:hypothetical protein [Plebeiobacterium sediminum]MCW3789674.1 hypothetical protein [Plebeiobacterium sediminum]
MRRLYLVLSLIFISNINSYTQEHEATVYDAEVIKQIIFFTDTIYKLKDVEDGKWSVYFDKEKTKLFLSANIRNGQEIGTTQKYHKTGVLASERIYGKEVRDSIVKKWDSSGILKYAKYSSTTSIYEVEYYDADKVKSEQYLITDDQPKLLIEYYSNSNIKSIKTYSVVESGTVPFQFIEYSENGTAYKESTLKTEYIREGDNIIERILSTPYRYFVNNMPVSQEIYEKHIKTCANNG